VNKYKYIIFDADGTLIDYHKDAERAFRTALSAIGREDALAACFEYDYGNWDKIGLSDVHLPAVRARYHDLYREHVRGIFDYAGKLYGFSDRAREAEALFNAAFSAPAHVIDGAEELLGSLSQGYKICIATNGLSGMQRGRLSALSPCLHRIFISEEIGAVKPDGAFFSFMRNALGASAEECLMVGDSLESDGAGAKSAGMDFVYYNPASKPLPQGISVTAEIRRLRELADLLKE